MTKKNSYKKIFTQQGELGKVQKTPNLDFLMNIFNIPRIYGVSGFGKWNVGQHSLCTAFIALYWAKFKKYSNGKRDQLVTLAITHDLHEAVTGDILPFFKTPDARKMIDFIQKDLENFFAISYTQELKKELKLIDMVSFLYEIKSSDSSREEKANLLKQIYARQRSDIFIYIKKAGFEKRVVEEFLKTLDL